MKFWGKRLAWSGNAIHNACGFAYLIACVQVALAIGWSQDSYGQDRIEVVPYPYRQVYLPQVDVKPGVSDRGNSLIVAEENKVFHFVQLDRSPLGWADDLLRIESGFPEPWTPENRYSLFPEGYQQESKKTVAFLARVMIVFDGMFDDRLRPVVYGLNRPEYSMFRQGEFLVVAKGAERRWYFESPDNGRSWRLAQMELTRQPGLYTRLEYTNELIGRVIFPNGKSVEIKHENFLPSEIKAPWGETTQIKRSKSGHVSAILVSRPDRTGKLVPSYSFTYENDGTGRMQKFTDKFGNVSKVEYRESTDANGKVYTAIIHNLADGSFRVKKHTVFSDLKWEMTDSYGSANQSPDDAGLTRFTRLAKVGSRYRAVTVAEGLGKTKGPEINYELDKIGGPKVKTDALGRMQVSEFDRLGKPTVVRSPSGDRSFTSHNEMGQLTRQIDAGGAERLIEYDVHGRKTREVTPDGSIGEWTYGPLGELLSASVNDRTAEFQTDEWGRIIQQNDAGIITFREFDQFGQLIRFQRIRPAKDEQKQSEIPWLVRNPEKDVILSEVTIEWNGKGQVLRIARSADQIERYIYADNGLLSMIVRPDTTRVTFQYDRLGRLTQRSDPAKRVESYSYHLNSRVKTKTVIEPGGKRSEYEYDLLGRPISEKKPGEIKPKISEYDIGGRLVKVTHPDGSTTLYAYDMLDRVVSVRGNHQPEVDYVYDADGKRIVKESGAKPDTATEANSNMPVDSIQ